MITAFSGMSQAEKQSALQQLSGNGKKEIFRVDLSQIVSKYAGETEKQLSKIFDEADRKGWILFFDEADALFGKRTDVKDAHDKYANQEITYLLQRLESFKGTAVFASDNVDNMPEALKRRVVRGKTVRGKIVRK